MNASRLGWIALALCFMGACSDPPSVANPEEALTAAAVRTRASRGPDWPAPPEDGAPLLARFEALIDDDGQRRAELRLFNFGDRDISKVEFNLRYLDAGGKELRSLPWKALPSLSAQTHARHVVGALLPEATVRVDPRLVRVQFVDGGVWAPEPEPSRAP